MGAGQGQPRPIELGGSYAVEFLPSARRELAALPKDVQRRLANRIDGLREDPRPPGAKQLQGEDRLYRLRVGDYPVIYYIAGPRLVILVVRVGHRRDVYRKR